MIVYVHRYALRTALVLCNNDGCILHKCIYVNKRWGHMRKVDPDILYFCILERGLNSFNLNDFPIHMKSDLVFGI